MPKTACVGLSRQQIILPNSVCILIITVGQLNNLCCLSCQQVTLSVSAGRYLGVPLPYPDMAGGKVGRLPWAGGRYLRVPPSPILTWLGGRYLGRGQVPWDTPSLPPVLIWPGVGTLLRGQVPWVPPSGVDKLKTLHPPIPRMPSVKKDNI